MKTIVTTVLLILATLNGLSTPAFGESPDEVYSFADHLQKDGMFEAAAQQFLRFARENPTDRRSPSALERAADCLQQAGQTEQALKVLETLTETYAQDADMCQAKIQLGRLYHKLERFESAERVYTEVVVTMPECAKVPEALLGKAEALIALGKFEAASDVLSSLVANFIESAAAPRASYHLAFCLRKLGREAEALNTYQRICTQFPGDPLAGFASLEAARMHAARGDTTAAMSFYDNARRMDAKVFFVPASEEGAAMLEAGGRFERALAWYEELLARTDLEDPRTIHIKAVRAAYRARDFEGVRRITQDYKNRYPKTFSPQINYYSALTRLERAEYGQVLTEADELEAFAPGTQWAQSASKIRGDALLAMGRPREAVDEYRRFVSLGADSTSKVLVLGKIADVQLAVMKDTTSALNTMVEILDTQRRAIPSEMLRVAAFIERAGGYKQSKTVYEDLTARYPLSDETETAEARIDFLNEYTVTDYAAAAAAMDRIAYEIATMGNWEALIRLVGARIDVLKDFESALRLCKQIKKASKETAHYPQILWLEGLSQAKLARIAHDAGKPEETRKRLEQALESWKELEDKHGDSPWATEAAFRRASLSYEVGGEVDTAAIQRVLARYPGHPGGAELMELLGDYYLETARSPSDSEKYYRQALAAVKGDDNLRLRRLRFKVASSLYESGKHEEAFEMFERIAASDEGRVGLRAAYEAGRTLRQLKRYGDAVPHFDRVVDRDRRGTFGQNAMLQGADCRYLQKDYADALERYRMAEKATRNESRAWDISLRIALCLEQLGRNEEALARLEKGLARSQGAASRPLAYVHAAEIARKQGDSQRELRLLESFVAEVKEGEEVAAARRDLVRRYLKADQPDRAAALAEQISRSAAKDDNEAKALLAMTNYRQGRLDRARDLAAEIAKNSNNDRSLAAEIAVEQAKYYYSQKSYREAAASLAAVAKDCGEPGVCEEVRYQYALSLIGAEQMDEATAVARAFFKDYPMSKFGPMLHLKIGNVLEQTNRTSESLLHYEEAAATTADSTTAFIALKNLGVSYQKLKRWREAELVWVRLLNRFPSSPFAREAAMNVARCKSETGDYTGAISAYEASLPLLDSETKARAYYWMASAYEQLGDFQSAVVEYLKVPFLSSGGGAWVVTAQLKAAECYTRIDRNDAAREIYNRVVQQYGVGSNWGKLAKEKIDGMTVVKPDSTGSGGQR